MKRIQKLIFQQSYSIIQILSKTQSHSTFLVQNIKTQDYFICKHFIVDNIHSNEKQAVINQINVHKTIKHPNIIQLKQSFKNQKEIAFIQQYCQQGDLAYHIKEQQKIQKLFKQEIVEQWVLQILFVLDYLHMMKVIHRDLNPSRVFLTKKGNIKIGSFGLSKTLKKQKFTKTSVQSQYMSPQIINNKPYDMRTDIWGLGCIIYELCTLKFPFESSSLMQLMNKINKSEVQDIPVSYSAFLSSIARRCLRKNPQKRPTAFQLLRQPYFRTVMDKFVKNNGVISKNVAIKKYKVHDKLKDDLFSKIKKKQVKPIKIVTQSNIKSEKIQRKSSMTPKNKQKLPLIKSKNKALEKVVSSIQKVKQKIFSLQKQKDKKTIETSFEKQRDKLKKGQKQKLLIKNKQTKQQTKINKSTKTIEKPKSQDKKKIQSLQKLKSIIKDKQQPKSNIEGTKLFKIKPNIPISPYKAKNKNESTKNITLQSINSSPTTSEEKIKEKQSNWLEEQQIDYSLTKTGKFDKQFDFLKKPPTLSQNLSSRDSHSQIQDSFRLTSGNGDAISMIQSYKSKMEQVSKELMQKYQPRMQTIQQRTFEFGSDEFVKDPGNFQLKQQRVQDKSIQRVQLKQQKQTELDKKQDNISIVFT